MKKEEINFVFEKNPDLSKIGTKEQYEKYLETIIPDSKVKDIVYRGNNIKFDLPTNNNIGIYLTVNKNRAFQYGERITQAIIGTINPYYTNDRPDIYWKRIIDNSDRLSNHDSIIFKEGDEIISSPSKTHILGSKKDVEGFKKYIKKSKDTLENKVISGMFIFIFLASIFFLSTNITGNTIGNITESGSKFIGIILFLLGISGFFIYRKLRS